MISDKREGLWGEAEQQGQEGPQPWERGQPPPPERSRGTHPQHRVSIRRTRALGLLKQHFVPHQLFTRHTLPAAGHSTGKGTAGKGDAAQMTAKIHSPTQPELITL